MDTELLVPLGVGLGLGLLVGLQREWAHREMAGIRTFPLITLLGVLAGTLSEPFGGWVVAAGLVSVAALAVTANVLRRRVADPDGPGEIGLTTEMAALVMFAVGAALPLGYLLEGVVVAGILAVLLQAKEPLHGAIRALSDRDVRIVFRFVLVALVVLPVLPNRDYGPYEVLNPFEIWLMVVLIVGISTAAWVAYRLLGPRRGTALTGLLGGLISSTATTVSQARRTTVSRGEAGAAAFVVIMASAAAFARILLELWVVARGSFAVLAPPVSVVLVVLLAAAGVQWRRGVQPGEAALEEPRSELGAAIVFGLLYAVVLLAVAAAQDHLGTAGIYGVAALSGLTDMDAITLSTAQLVRVGTLEADAAWRVVLVAAMANLVFKGGIVVVAAGRTMRRPVLAAFGAALATSTLVLAAWP